MLYDAWSTLSTSGVVSPHIRLVFKDQRVRTPKGECILLNISLIFLRLLSAVYFYLFFILPSLCVSSTTFFPFIS